MHIAHTLANIANDIVERQVVLRGIRVVFNADVFIVDVFLSSIVVVIIDDQCSGSALHSDKATPT